MITYKNAIHSPDQIRPKSSAVLIIFSPAAKRNLKVPSIRLHSYGSISHWLYRSDPPSRIPSPSVSSRKRACRRISRRRKYHGSQRFRLFSKSAASPAGSPACLFFTFWWSFSCKHCKPWFALTVVHRIRISLMSFPGSRKDRCFLYDHDSPPPVLIPLHPDSFLRIFPSAFRRSRCVPCLVFPYA